MKISMWYKFLISFMVSVLLRPVFVNDGEYVTVCLLAGIGLATVFALVESKAK